MSPAFWLAGVSACVGLVLGVGAAGVWYRGDVVACDAHSKVLQSTVDNRDATIRELQSAQTTLRGQLEEQSRSAARLAFEGEKARVRAAAALKQVQDNGAVARTKIESLTALIRTADTQNGSARSCRDALRAVRGTLQ